MPTLSLSQIAAMVNARIVGDPAMQVARLTTLEQAGPDDLTFLSNPKYRNALKASRAGAVLCQDLIPEFSGNQLVVANPYLAFANLLTVLYPRYRPEPGVHPLAVIEQSVSLGEGCAVGPHVVIGAESSIGERVVLFPGVYIGPYCSIGDDSLIYPNVVVMERVTIGRRVIIQAGCVIGADGYGFVQDGTKHVKIPQVGSVVIEDDVEFGANTTVDRATLGETRIGKGTKTDDQVHIAHNVSLGEHCLLVAQSGISGSAKIGNRVTIAGQAGIAGHLSIGDDSIIAARGGITKSLPEGSVVGGFPAQPLNAWRRTQAIYLQLPELLDRVRTLERQVADLSLGKEEAGP